MFHHENMNVLHTNQLWSRWVHWHWYSIRLDVIGCYPALNDFLFKWLQKTFFLTLHLSNWILRRSGIYLASATLKINYLTPMNVITSSETQLCGYTAYFRTRDWELLLYQWYVLKTWIYFRIYNRYSICNWQSFISGFFFRRRIPIQKRLYKT